MPQIDEHPEIDGSSVMMAAAGVVNNDGRDVI